MNPGLFVCYNGFGDSMERIEKQMEFILEIDKEKQIKRKTLQSNGKDFEDDAQQAWHMAIMTLLLNEYANEEIDVLKTISMLLIHDLVEIDAGDTYAYDSQGLKTQSKREKLPQIVFLIYCQKIRQKKCLIYGMNLKKEKRLKLSLLGCWTIFSQLC